MRELPPSNVYPFATHVASGQLLVTLAPFLAGTILAVCGLVLTRPSRETQPAKLWREHWVFHENLPV